MHGNGNCAAEPASGDYAISDSENAPSGDQGQDLALVDLDLRARVIAEAKAMKDIVRPETQ